ncbi:Uncharacterised protein [Vibrio cholerae]|nr:Uncharacterised protein [Vibrio cholerae]
MQRNLDHLIRHRHFKVHARLQRFTQNTDIAICDVTTIFTQMDGDAIRARTFSNFRCMHWIGILCAACVTQSRHVIDIHTKIN